MKKLILSSCLVAGTAVGAGMIALPMVLCKIGIFSTIGLILTVWFIMNISSLLSVELNLRIGQSLPLGKLASFYSGPIASLIGTTSLFLLISALICAYLYGGASVMYSFIGLHFHQTIDIRIIILVYGLLLMIILMSSISNVLQMNRFLFISLLITFSILITGLIYKIPLDHLPFFTPTITHLYSWTGAIPLLATSFGYQVILHTLVNFTEGDPVLLKRSIFWGGLISAVVYIIWTVSTISVLSIESPSSYQQLLAGDLEVGQFIQALAQTTTWPFVQILTSFISLIAILKSSIGVSLGLFEAWQEQIAKINLPKGLYRKLFIVLITLGPSLIIALFIPQLFLKALRFAGMISIVIAIFSPIWLITRPRAKEMKAIYTLTKNKMIQAICFIFGMVVIICEIINIFWLKQ